MQAAMIRLAKSPARVVTVGADQRQHRGVGQVEQQHTDREREQASVGEQSSQSRPVEWLDRGLLSRMRAATDRQQRQQRGDAQRGGQHEHRAAGQVGAGRAHHRRGEPVAERGEAGVTPQPFAERGVADQMQADRGDRGREHAARECVQRLRDRHRQFGRLDRQQQGGDDHADQCAARGGALVAHGIHQRAGGKLADQRDDGAEREDEADLHLGPFVRGQIDGDERAEAGLHIGDEEVHQIERPRTARRKFAAGTASAHRGASGAAHDRRGLGNILVFGRGLDLVLCQIERDRMLRVGRREVQHAPLARRSCGCRHP